MGALDDDDATETDAETTTTALDESEVEQSGISAKPVRFSRRRPRWRLLAVAAGVLGTCGFVAVTAVMFWQHHKVEAEHARDAAFVAAARHDVEMMLSIDYSKAKEDVQRIIDNSTGKFRETSPRTLRTSSRRPKKRRRCRRYRSARRHCSHHLPIRPLSWCRSHRRFRTPTAPSKIREHGGCGSPWTAMVIS